MTKLAVNYSPHAAELLAEGKIDVDIFKSPNLLDVVERARPCYVHFPFRAGRGLMGEVDWSEVDRLIAASDTPYVNMHLCPCLDDFPGMRLDTADAADRARLLEAMARDVRTVAERYDADRVILENVMWDPFPPWSVPAPALEAEVIGRVVRETGCGFVLDISHAVISARYFGLDEKAYISSLPIEHVRELHISGIQLDKRGLWQDHNPMTDFDWEMTSWAAERLRAGDWSRPWVVALEYSGVGKGYEREGDYILLSEQLPKLAGMVSDLRKG